MNKNCEAAHNHLENAQYVTLPMVQNENHPSTELLNREK